MTNKSTVHLQPAPPTVLTAQEAVARLAAAEAEIVRLRAGMEDLRLYDHEYHVCPLADPPESQWPPGTYHCMCRIDAHNARIAALLQEGADA